MNREQMEMEIKEIILDHVEEMKKISPAKVAENVFEFSNTRYAFNTKQFDLISLDLIEYINQYHGGEKENQA